MATIKVKKQGSKAEGKASVIMYQITNQHKKQRPTTNPHMQSSNRDAKKGELIPCTPNRIIPQRQINKNITSLKGEASSHINKNRRSVSNITNRHKPHDKQISILTYISHQIEQLRAMSRFGTAKNYEKTLNSFRTFLNGSHIPISALTEQVITDYNIFLIRRGLVRNSISFYMRVLRAIYNKAVRQKLIEQQHPFTEVYTGIDHTPKRAVPESIIAQLYRLEIDTNSSLALCRDLFIFSYCTRGMAFADIAYLKKVNLQNGMICYARRKTGQFLRVRIEPNIRQIIDRYTKPETPYVFPILTSTEASEAYRQYQTALNTHNRLLGRLSEILNCSCKLTSYTPRHSWATAARNHNIPVSIISQGMGHASEQTTQIYLAMLDNSVIDDANKNIIDMLCE